MKGEASDVSGLGAKLDILIRLFAINAVASLESQKEKAVLLNKAGLTPKEIAQLLDSTPNTISVALSKDKKEKG